VRSHQFSLRLRTSLLLFFFSFEAFLVVFDQKNVTLVSLKCDFETRVLISEKLAVFLFST